MEGITIDTKIIQIHLEEVKIGVPAEYLAYLLVTQGQIGGSQITS